MVKKRKIYFYATESTSKATGKSSLIFVGKNGMRGHRAGGSEEKINFVLEKLIEKNGAAVGMEIYKKFNEALLAVAKEDEGKVWGFPKAALVLMEKIDDNTIQQRPQYNAAVKNSVYSGEQRPIENAGSKEEGTSST